MVDMQTTTGYFGGSRTEETHGSRHRTVAARPVIFQLEAVWGTCWLLLVDIIDIIAMPSHIDPRSNPSPLGIVTGNALQYILSSSRASLVWPSFSLH